MIDLKDLEAKSDQMNAVDLVAPVVFRINKVDYFPRKKEQCIHLHLEGCEGRPYKPCKGMLRGLVKAWGKDETLWAGRLIEIFCEPSVKWGGEETGGIEISALSEIGAPVTFTKVLNRSKRVKHTFSVLTEEQEVVEEFIKTHHEDNIKNAETNEAIDLIVKNVRAKFGDEKMGELKDAVVAAREKLAANSATNETPSQ